MVAETVGYDTDYEDRGLFQVSVGQVVSANLCEALVKLTQSRDDFEINIVWARTYPSYRLRTVGRLGDNDGLYVSNLSRALRHQITERDATR